MTENGFIEEKVKNENYPFSQTTDANFSIKLTNSVIKKLSSVVKVVKNTLFLFAYKTIYENIT